MKTRLLHRGSALVEDLVIVVGGAIVIAGAWVIYKPAGVVAIGIVLLLIGIVSYRHRHPHHPTRTPREVEHATYLPKAWQPEVHDRPDIRSRPAPNDAGKARGLLETPQPPGRGSL